MVHAATKLLDDFRSLPGRVVRPLTFMEIAGNAHYENACSNVLAFFMDPEESHGLGTLVLDALASAGDVAGTDGGVGGNVSVDREVGTDAGNRIDILVTSDDRVILIENKIHAAANNPFDDYAAYLDKIAGDRNKRKILLTLHSISVGGEWGFTNLTHEEFVGQIRSLLGRYVASADARHLTMFLDFLNTLENLKEGTRMDKEFIKLLAERGTDARDFFAKLTQFKDELQKKVRELGNLIELGEHKNVEQIFHREKTSLQDILIHDIHVFGDTLVRIDTPINPHGWEILIWPRTEDWAKLRALLQRLEIPFEEKQVEQHQQRFVHPDHFAYDEDPEQVRLVLQEIIDKLATSREHEE